MDRHSISIRLVRLAAAGLIALVAACGSTTVQPTPTPSNHDLHVWPELEQQIPDSISGRGLTKVSLAAHPDRQDAKTLAVLRQLGRTTDHLQLANAELEGTDLQIGAMRIVGSQGDQIIQAFRAVDAGDPNSQANYSQVDLGGKRVTAREVGGIATYLYGHADIMFIVSGAATLVEAALRQLPS